MNTDKTLLFPPKDLQAGVNVHGDDRVLVFPVSSGVRPVFASRRSRENRACRAPICYFWTLRGRSRLRRYASDALGADAEEPSGTRQATVVRWRLQWTSQRVLLDKW